MNTRTFPQLVLERYVLGELPEAHAAEVSNAADSDPQLMARLKEIAESNKAILAQYPANVVSRDVALRAHTERVLEEAAHAPRRRAARAVAPALGVALLLAVALVPVLTVHHGTQVAERVKGGGAQLVVYLNTSEGPRLLSPMDTVRPGDMLQIGYVAGGKSHGAIFSLDGRGQATLHFPGEPGGSTALEQDGEHLLGFSYQLDDAPQFEHFYFVTSDTPLDAAAVMDSARSYVAQFGSSRSPAAMRLPPGATFTSLVLRK